MAQVIQLKEKLSSSAISIEHMKIDERTLKRYLKAFHTVDAAYERILATNAWRQDFDVANITRNTPGVKKTFDTKICEILNQRDRQERPLIYVAVRNHSIQKRNVDDMTLFIVYMLETAADKCQEDGPDNVCLLFDMKNFSLMCMDYAVLKTLYTIMTDHYPERLGVCLVLNAPFIFSACWVIIRSWLDDNTAGKIKFIKSDDELSLYIDPTFLPADL
ncbi:uncharacterized protein [Procambarus clarkii]|uniref:uncharacterized protein n=1 Tax=Procambarus clarkii TaxID=6728 RepID=UPI00374234E6